MGRIGVVVVVVVVVVGCDERILVGLFRCGIMVVSSIFCILHGTCKCFDLGNGLCGYCVFWMESERKRERERGWVVLLVQN